MPYNSTIRVKTGKCEMCDYYGPLTKGLCSNHYWLGVRMRSAEKQASKEIKEDGLQDLISDLDALVSKFVRQHYADHRGLCKCYTCSTVLPWKELDAGHYIKRGCMYLRFDVARNIRPQCVFCNRMKDGKFAQFGKNLELELPGVTEILWEEMRIVYHHTRDELKTQIADYSQRIKLLFPK